MSPRSTLQVPRARDLSRLAFARASSRLALGRGPIDAVARFATLQREIAATVRLVSPLLLALIDGSGLSVADLVEDMGPAPMAGTARGSGVSVLHRVGRPRCA